MLSPEANGFRFDEAWWARIEPTLPPAVKPSEARYMLERRFEQYRQRPNDPGAEAKRWAKIAAAHEDSEQQRKAEAMAEHYRIMTMPSRYPTKDRNQAQRRPNREQLFRHLLIFWQFHAGDEPPPLGQLADVLKITNNITPEGRTIPGGKLLAFMLAALSGIDNAPGAGTVVDIIKRERRRQKNMLPPRS
jgi:hypothetical protein